MASSPAARRRHAAACRLARTLGRTDSPPSVSARFKLPRASSFKVMVAESKEERICLVRLAVGIALLLLGWTFMAVGLYSLALLAAQPAGPGVFNSAEAASSFLFAFGVMSVAVLLASRAALRARPRVHRAFLGSLVASSVLCLGYLGIASLGSFLGL